MGCDIHWIIERLHSDGSWEACASRSHEAEFSSTLQGPDGYYASAQSSFGNRDYNWFGILSSVREDSHDEVGEIAIEGLPDDASEHTTIAFDTDWLHTQGYFNMPRLIEARDKISKSQVPTPDHIVPMIDGKIKALKEMLNGEGPHPLSLDKIIFGRRHEEDTFAPFPDMMSESNHHKLQRVTRTEGLMPIADDTVRVIIAYDS